MSDPSGNALLVFLWFRIQSSYVPWGYETPKFPSLRWPSGSSFDTRYYLYHQYDIWKFTLYWTLILFTSVHGVAGLWAALANHRHRFKVGGIEAVISGSIIGAILGLIYTAGSFTMSTWIPFTWAIIQVLTIIMSSYSMASVVM
ncbi:hypothetical protein V1511DRAFT_508007 [Dipodascopsis uninucleata]